MGIGRDGDACPAVQEARPKSLATAHGFSIHGWKAPQSDGSGSRHPGQGARFNASTALSPPNANELLSTARTGISRAVFGT